MLPRTVTESLPAPGDRASELIGGAGSAGPWTTIVSLSDPPVRLSVAVLMPSTPAASTPPERRSSLASSRRIADRRLQRAAARVGRRRDRPAQPGPGAVAAAGVNSTPCAVLRTCTASVDGPGRGGGEHLAADDREVVRRRDRGARRRRRRQQREPPRARLRAGVADAPVISTGTSVVPSAPGGRHWRVSRLALGGADRDLDHAPDRARRRHPHLDPRAGGQRAVAEEAADRDFVRGLAIVRVRVANTQRGAFLADLQRTSIVAFAGTLRSSKTRDPRVPFVAAISKRSRNSVADRRERRVAAVAVLVDAVAGDVGRARAGSSRRGRCSRCPRRGTRRRGRGRAAAGRA